MSSTLKNVLLIVGITLLVTALLIGVAFGWLIPAFTGVNVFGSGSKAPQIEILGQSDYDYISSALYESGNSSVAIKSVDISSREGKEFLALAKKDGTWYLYIYFSDNTSPIEVFRFSLADNDKAYYLVNEAGEDYLLDYTQDFDDGTHYAYSLFRFDEKGKQIEADSDSVSYYEHSPDATAVSDFFNRFNKYFDKAKVVSDPYVLLGDRWMTEADYGQVEHQELTPAEPVKTGYVNIKDSSSWLNLRTGPGTQYSRVLTNENDKESYVKQAKGAPVTILETIEVNEDPENPVWVKIKITYNNREFIGYSSKTFIKTVN